MSLAREIVYAVIEVLPGMQEREDLVIGVVLDHLVPEYKKARTRRARFINGTSGYDVRLFQMYDAEVRNMEEAIYYMVRKGYGGCDFSNPENDTLWLEMCEEKGYRYIKDNFLDCYLYDGVNNAIVTD